MENRFKNKYRTNSLRLKGFNYGSEAIYFITICTKNRIQFLGRIQNEEIKLTTAGSIVAREWVRTKEIRSRVVLGEWVVMPNHFHALLYLKPKKKPCRDGSHPSKLQKEDQSHNFTKDNNPEDYKNEFGPQSNNLSSIIRGFKSICTRKIRENGLTEFGWQRGYYDHVVRSQKALTEIEEYIRENPRRWIDDKYYKAVE